MQSQKNGLIQYDYKIIGKSGIVHLFNAYVNDGYNQFLIKKVEMLDSMEYIKILGEHIDVGLPVIIIASNLGKSVEQFIEDYKDIIVFQEGSIEDISYLDLVNIAVKKQ
ncbi:MAG: hypothetical protein J7K23_05550 [Thermoproteales archaeon]|nr:hypothetical protein [Thermoproteales archaeon]